MAQSQLVITYSLRIYVNLHISDIKNEEGQIHLFYYFL